MKTKLFILIILSSMLLVTVFAGLGGAKSLMDVFVTNTSDNPIPVLVTNPSDGDESSTVRPFQYSWEIEVEANTVGFSSGFPTPAGKVLVVEYITINMIASSQFREAMAEDTFSALAVTHYDTWDSDQDRFEIGRFDSGGITRETKFYVGAEKGLYISMGREIGGYPFWVLFTVSGYYIDNPSYENDLPHAHISEDIMGIVGYVDTPLTFNGGGSYDFYPGTIVAYDWDFGDGNTGTGVNPTNTYAATGEYTATLRVTDDEGATDIDTAIVRIYTG
jgi:hypothetical protein